MLPTRRPRRRGSGEHRAQRTKGEHPVPVAAGLRWWRRAASGGVIDRTQQPGEQGEAPRPTGHAGTVQRGCERPPGAEQLRPGAVQHEHGGSAGALGDRAARDQHGRRVVGCDAPGVAAAVASGQRVAAGGGAALGAGVGRAREVGVIVAALGQPGGAPAGRGDAGRARGCTPQAAGGVHATAAGRQFAGRSRRQGAGHGTSCTAGASRSTGARSGAAVDNGSMAGGARRPGLWTPGRGGGVVAGERLCYGAGRRRWESVDRGGRVTACRGGRIRRDPGSRTADTSHWARPGTAPRSAGRCRAVPRWRPGLVR